MRNTHFKRLLSLLAVSLAVFPLWAFASILPSCLDLDPNDLQRYYDPPPAHIDPATLPLEIRCASLNQSITFLPTQENAEQQRAILEYNSSQRLPAFQEGNIGISFQISPGIVERPATNLSFCLDMGQVCEPLLVWNSQNISGSISEQMGFTEMLPIKSISRTSAKTIYADLLIPPDLVDSLRPQVSEPQEYIVRVSMADATHSEALGIPLASVPIVDIFEEADANNGRNTRSDDTSSGSADSAASTTDTSNTNNSSSNDSSDSTTNTTDANDSTGSSESSYMRQNAVNLNSPLQRQNGKTSTDLDRIATNNIQKDKFTDNTGVKQAETTNLMMTAGFKQEFPIDALLKPVINLGIRAGIDRKVTGPKINQKMGGWLFGSLKLQFGKIFGFTPPPVLEIEAFYGKIYEKVQDQVKKDCVDYEPTLKLLGINVKAIYIAYQASQGKNVAGTCSPKEGKKERQRETRINFKKAEISLTYTQSVRIGSGFTYKLPYKLGETIFFAGGEGLAGVKGASLLDLSSLDIRSLGPFISLAGVAEASLDVAGSISLYVGAKLTLLEEHFAVDMYIPFDGNPTVGLIKNILQGPYGKAYFSVKVPILGSRSFTIMEVDSGIRFVNILVMWPEALAKVDAANYYDGLQKISAACKYGEGKVLLSEHNQTGKYDEKQELIRGYPKVTTEVFPGVWVSSLISGVDACVKSDGKIFAFKGGEFVRFDIGNGSVDRNFPAPISGLGKFGNKGLDAVTSDGNGNFYFFKGDKVIKTKGIGGRASDPKPISTYFPGIWKDGIEGALHDGNNIYFFKDDKFIAFSLISNTAGNEKPVKERWGVDTSSLPESLKPYNPPPLPRCDKVFDQGIKADTDTPQPVEWLTIQEYLESDSAFQAGINAEDGNIINICRDKQNAFGSVSNQDCQTSTKTASEYDVLAIGEGLSWAFASGGKKLAGAVEGYICRARSGLSYRIGSVGNAGCKINNTEEIKHYEILVH